MIFTPGWLIKLRGLLGLDDVLEADINLAGSGNFTGGSIRVTRVGKQVVINVTATVTHASLSSADSAAGMLPEWARPPISTLNMYHAAAAGIFSINAQPSGVLGFQYFNWSGASLNRTDAGSRGMIAYNV